MLTRVVYDLYNCCHEAAETLYSSWQDARLQDRKQLFRTPISSVILLSLVVKRNIPRSYTLRKLMLKLVVPRDKCNVGAM